MYFYLKCLSKLPKNDVYLATMLYQLPFTIIILTVFFLLNEDISEINNLIDSHNRQNEWVRNFYIIDHLINLNC